MKNILLVSPLGMDFVKIAVNDKNMKVILQELCGVLKCGSSFFSVSELMFMPYDVVKCHSPFLRASGSAGGFGSFRLG